MARGIVRQRMGPTFVNHCGPEKVGTKEYGRMFKRIQVLEEGRIPAKKAGSRREISWLRKGYGTLPKKYVGRHRGALPTKRTSTEGVQSYARREFSEQLAARGCGRRRKSRNEGVEEISC